MRWRLYKPRKGKRRKKKETIFFVCFGIIFSIIYSSILVYYSLSLLHSLEHLYIAFSVLKRKCILYLGFGILNTIRKRTMNRYFYLLEDKKMSNTYSIARIVSMLYFSLLISKEIKLSVYRRNMFQIAIMNNNKQILILMIHKVKTNFFYLMLLCKNK